ncbi:MAG: phosphatidate cytidylyltransferase [Bacilli bacterium]|nr:phosphatidate cytidylyltransferase [Bacilli bacterium]
MGKHRPIFQPNELSNDTAASMKTRIIAGLTAIAIILPFVMFGDWPFFGFMILVLVFAIIEIIRCAKTKYSKVLYIVAFLLAFLILFWNFFQDMPHMFKNTDRWSGIYDSYNRISVSITIMFIGICLSSLTMLVDKNFTIMDACFIFTTVVLIALGLESILFIRYFPVYEYHQSLKLAGETVPYINAYDNCESFLFLLYMALGACLNDAFAYFVGVFFGKHKMNPRVSPKKTWEGFFGGVILTSAFISGFAFIMSAVGHPVLNGLLDIKHWYHIVILSTLIPLVSVLGDLVFSSIKRHYQIKDFSNLIPGHGGILDRLDSIIFAAITVAIYTSIFCDVPGGFILP